MCLRKFHRRLPFLFDNYCKLSNVAGNTPAIAEKVSESDSVECAFVRENELDMRFVALSPRVSKSSCFYY
jgi:hypothetical protein